jgi:hypothetical protein
MYYLEFRTKICIDNILDTIHFNKSTANVTYTHFLGLVSVTWNNHIDQLISRLNSACYAIRAVNATLSRLYFSYIHSSIISYSIIFGVTPLTVLKYSDLNKN